MNAVVSGLVVVAMLLAPLCTLSVTSVTCASTSTGRTIFGLSGVSNPGGVTDWGVVSYTYRNSGFPNAQATATPVGYAGNTASYSGTFPWVQGAVTRTVTILSGSVTIRRGTATETYSLPGASGPWSLNCNPTAVVVSQTAVRPGSGGLLADVAAVALIFVLLAAVVTILSYLFGWWPFKKE